MTRRAAIALTILCLVAGSGWILEAALPAALPGSLALLVDNSVLAMVFYLAAGRRLPSGAKGIFGYTAIVFAVPAALVSLCDGHLSSTSIVLVYTLVPAATIFFAAQSSDRDLPSLLAPALAGLTGAALILPFTLPASLAGRLWLGAMLASAFASGFAGLKLHTLLTPARIFPAATLAAMASALVTLPLYAFDRPTLVLLTWPQALLSASAHLAAEGATLLLTVRLLRDADPIAFSTRYLLIPCVTIAEGYLVLRPHAPWTLVGGLVLLCGGSALLLRGHSREHQP